MEDTHCQRNVFMTLMKASTTDRLTGSTSNTLNETIRVSKAIPDHYLDINWILIGIHAVALSAPSAASSPRRRCVSLVNAGF